MKLIDSHAVTLVLAEKPATFTSTPYQGRNITTSSTIPLTAAT